MQVPVKIQLPIPQLLDSLNPYSGSNYFCFSTGGACLAGETISPQYVYDDGVVATGAAAPVGEQPLDQPASSVAEASSVGWGQPPAKVRDADKPSTWRVNATTLIAGKALDLHA